MTASASPLLLFNATLSSVATAGFAPDYDRPATAGASKFTGSERVFLHEPLVERLSVGVQSDVLVQRGMLVDPALAVAWAIGDIVTFTRDTLSSSETAVVQHVMTAGSPETGYTTRLVFEDA